jgi:hypothetical protein
MLDGLLPDVMAQTREANLYAQTGTRNYWLPEAIQYAQGSDHDVFLGLGIPSTMFGHDPDWTHHTSEDKIDKTDASEFRRVGTMASAATYFLAFNDPATWRGLYSRKSANRVSELSTRLAQNPGFAQNTLRTGKNWEAFQNEVKGLNEALKAPGEVLDISAASGISLKPGPHRLTLLPLDASVFENASPEDAKWLAEQEARFASDSEGLATKPNFGLISFEAINFMDGHRSTSEIADLVSAEYLIDIDQPWVDRLVSILEKQKLVAK